MFRANPKAVARLNRQMSERMKTIIDRKVAEAKQDARVRTGRYRDSIHAEDVSTDEQAAYVIASDVPYALKLEAIDHTLGGVLHP